MLEGICVYNGLNPRFPRSLSTLSADYRVIWWSIGIYWANGEDSWRLATQEINEHHSIQCGNGDISTYHDPQLVSFQAQAWGPDRLDRLMTGIEQMYCMLESHVQQTSDQFAYIQGQITALSSKIKDMSMAQGSNSESDKF